MAPPSLKLFSKRRLGFLAVVLSALLVAGFSVAANRFLRTVAPSFAGLIREQLKIGFSFGHIRYIFPNHVVLKEVSITEPSAGTVIAQVPVASLRFSFPIFSSRHKIRLSGLSLTGPSVQMAALNNYLQRHAALVLSYIKSIPRGDMRVDIMSKDFHLDFDLHPSHFSGRGSLGNKTYEYSLEGDINEFGIVLKKLTAKGTGLSMNLWGNCQDNNLEWKGFVMAAPPLTTAPLYVLDIDGKAVLKAQEIELPKLSFSVNGDALQAYGRWAKPGRLNGRIMYVRQAQQVNRQNPLKSVTIDVASTRQGPKPAFNGRLRADFLEGTQALQQLRLQLQGLQTAKAKNPGVREVSIRRAQMSALINGRSHGVAFGQGRAGLSLPAKDRLNLDFSAGMYGGRAHIHTSVDASGRPWQVSAQGKFEGVQAHLLSPALEYFAKCRGLLFADFQGSFPQNPIFSGTLSLPKAEFAGFDFLLWVSQNFQMPALAHLTQAAFTCRFKVDAKAAALEDFELFSRDLTLRGTYLVGFDELVSSRISAHFSSEVLKESPVGRRIWGLGKGARDLPFEFRLSGNFHRMNFEWEDSPLKARVQRQIPDFIQNIIDRRLNQ